jgi:hypothetical protein
MTLIKSCCFILLFVVSLNVIAQSDTSTRVTIAVERQPLTEVLKLMEERTGFRFYYDATLLDSIVLNVNLKDQPLEKALDQLLKNTTLQYAIDQQKNIFITPGKKIVTELPPGLFGGKSEVASHSFPAVVVEEEKTQVAQKATLENKLYEIGNKTSSLTAGNANLAGYVRDDKTGEPIIGVSLYIDQPRISVQTDQYGYYSITLPKGRHVLNIQSLGKRDTRRLIMLFSDGKLNIELHDQVMTLKEVIISASKARNVKEVQLGVERINILSIKQVPTVFGESDLLRVVLTLPGVKSVGEASTGFNVRGGAADQNLILFNDATIYNPSHFFGFFSAFNPDVVKEVELYKSSIPAKYGGRLSSVLDITGREGNKKNITGSAGLGLVTSRFNIEGPLVKDKSAFIFGARTTYANWLLGLLPDEYKKSKASFFDLNLLLNHELNKNNHLYLTGYFSQDRFRLNSDTTYGYSNKNISLKWKHAFSNKLYSVLTVGYDGYSYGISSNSQPITAYKLKFDIAQLNSKVDFNYYVNSNHTVDFGISSIRYQLHPGTYKPDGDQSLVIPSIVESEHARESAIYAGDKFNISSALSLNYGIRYSFYQYLGPQNIVRYADGIPKTESSILDSVVYNQGSVINSYHGPEYRIALRYLLTDNFSIKVGYNSLRQYIHMLSNTTAISPTDIWKLSDPNIKPEFGDQVSLGFYKNFKSNTIETSVEAYYKRLKDYLDYKSAATLLLNHSIETEVLPTRGKAYGLEFMIKKPTGKLNGWLSYTYSRTFLQTTDSSAGEMINRGEYYPANFDKPHDVTFVGNYRLSHRFSLSLNATYSTGRPITLPIGRYTYGGSERALYSDRNEFRIPDYFRTDFSMNIQGNHKVKQKTHNSWTIGIYNITARKNAYSAYFVSENGAINGYKLSIFGGAIPFINFNIRF